MKANTKLPDIIGCFVIMGAALFIGIRVAVSPSPIWLIVTVAIVCIFIFGGALDALITLIYDDNGRKGYS